MTYLVNCLECGFQETITGGAVALPTFCERCGDPLFEDFEEDN